MAPLALALHLALAAADPGADAATPPQRSVPATVDLASLPVPAPPPALAAPPPARFEAMTLAPRELDHGPFRVGEVAAATVGAFTGDALVLGAGYLALRMFADGTFTPTAANFRHAVYGVGVGALLLPPLTGVALAALVGGPHAPFGFWKAMLLATAGEAAALAVGYWAAPRFWVVVPVQALAVSLGASFGLHWGARRRAADPTDAAPEDGREAAAGRAAGTALLAVPLCPAS